MRVRSGLRCCCCGVKRDAEGFYRERTQGLKEQIRRELQRQKGHNTGYGFLIFSDERIIKDFKHFGKKYFNNLIDEKL